MGIKRTLTSLLNIVTAKKRPSLDAQKTRAIYKKRYIAQGGSVSIVSKIGNAFFPEVYPHSLPTSSDLSLCLVKKKNLAKYTLSVIKFDSNLDIKI
jgi:hypothetical protein